MFFSGKYIKALETLKQEVSEIRENLADYRARSDEELKTLKKTLKDLIIYVEEKDRTQEKIQDETEPAASETEMEFIRKIATDILEWTNSKPPGALPEKAGAGKPVFSEEEILAKYMKSPPWANELIKGMDKIIQKIDAIDKAGYMTNEPLWVTEFLKKAEELGSSIKSLLPIKDKISSAHNELEKSVAAVEKAGMELKKQLPKIKEYIENAKKDINSKISYAVARLKT